MRGATLARNIVSYAQVQCTKATWNQTTYHAFWNFEERGCMTLIHSPFQSSRVANHRWQHTVDINSCTRVLQAKMERAQTTLVAPFSVRGTNSRTTHCFVKSQNGGLGFLPSDAKFKNTRSFTIHSNKTQCVLWCVCRVHHLFWWTRKRLLSSPF